MFLLKVIIEENNRKCFFSNFSENLSCINIRALIKNLTPNTNKYIKQSNPITGLDRPWGFQEVKSPRFQDNLHMKVVRL